MRVYIIKRLLLVIPILLIASFAIFWVVDIIPGDIVDSMMAQDPEQRLDRATIEHELGLDAPIYIQYGRWLGVVPQMDGSLSGAFQDDFGTSWRRGSSVAELLGTAWPITLELGLMSLIVALLIALPVGIYSALRQDTWGDYIGRSFAILAISIPSFWLGTMIILYPAIWWDYMPPMMLIHFTDDPIGNLKMFIIPAIVMGMSISGMTMRMTRTMMLEVLRQDYIRTAWAKGLKERVIIIRHAVKNALIPVITLIAIYMPVLLGGAVIVEQIFVLPGLGRLGLTALFNRDEPVIRAVVLVFALALALVNLIVDLTYAYLDPRVHYK